MSLTHYGGYVLVDWETDGYEVDPLLCCLRFAISDSYPVDYYFDGIMLGNGPVGGDPGWEIQRVCADDGTVQYQVEVDSGLDFDLETSSATYGKDVFNLHLRRTLENYARVHPSAVAQVQRLVERYEL